MSSSPTRPITYLQREHVCRRVPAGFSLPHRPQISFGSTFSTFIGFEKEVMWAWFDVVADMGIPVVSRAPRIN